MSETDEMKVSQIDPARAKALISQLTEVQQRVAAVAKGRPVSSSSHRPHTSPFPPTKHAAPPPL